MKCNYILIILILTSYFNSWAVNVQISGFVRDKQSNEVLIGANVWSETQNSGISSDNRGYFSLKVSSPCILRISYVGYSTHVFNINASVDTLLIAELEPGNRLDEVVVTAATQNNNFDIVRISAKQLQLTPALGGKPDVMKTLQLLPGVQSQSEGMSMILVRGGDPGQNMYLLDNVPLIYVNHLGGFLSVFNPDMINSVDFYKGNFPARQGGKLSSIVDITQREGDVSKHQGSFSLGVTDASFSFEGPLANKKISYIVTVRKTLIDAFLGLTSTISQGNNAIVTYGFHDFNAKLTWKPDEKNSLSLNIYQGDDYLNYWGKPWEMGKDESAHLVQQWGNWLVSTRWNRVFSSKLYAENILSFSRYRNRTAQQFGYKEDGVKRQFETENRSSVQDFALRSAWKYALLRNWNVEFGGQASYNIYQPSYIYNSMATIPVQEQLFNAFETALYVDNKINIFPDLLLQPSLRFTYFHNDGMPFLSLEPRANLTLKVASYQYLNLNYMQVSQPSHLIFAQSEMLKKEIWLPATQNLKPQTSEQIAIGWNGSFDKEAFGTEINVYYKNMANLVALEEGYENMSGITGVENKVESGGKGVAYGAEFSVHKKSGKWTGSVTYAWSHTTRQFVNINHGKVFEYDFNRPHSVSLQVNREFTKSWNMNLVWVFQSGIPYTPALGKHVTIYALSGTYDKIALIYGEKNSARMKPYHRLDLGFNHTITTRLGNKAIWTFSLYNAYNHINPYTYYYDNDKSRQNTTYYSRPLQQYKLGLFSIIPSISYKVFFDYTKQPSKKVNKQKKKYNWLYFEE